MIEGIIYNNQPQEEAMNNRLLNLIQLSDAPDEVKEALTSYSDVAIHPTDGRIALIVKRRGYYWDLIKDNLTKKELDSIIELGEDWEINKETD
jgi:hypothetical protein